MNIVNDTITCISCKQKLKAPVILPCGHSICKHHVDEEEVENNKRRKIQCKSCNKTHNIPKNGFAPNNALESLIGVNIDELDLGKEYNSVLERFDEFEELLEQFNKAKKDPETRINSVLSDLRNKVDLKREELKQEIDKKALEIIDKINEYEKECKVSIKLDSNADNKIDEWRNELKQSRLVLNTLKKDTEKWNEISNKMTSHFKDLQSEFIKLNANLFLNRLNEFIHSDLKLTNDFYVVSVEVKELSRFKNIKENKNVFKHGFKAFGIEWILDVYIYFEEIEEDDIIQRYRRIKISCSDRGEIIQDFKFDIAFVILNQINMNNSNEIFNIKEQSEGIWILSVSTRLTDIFNDYYSYNTEKDSFIFQVVFKKIEWLYLN